MRSSHYPIVARQGLWLILPLLGVALYLLVFHGWLPSLPLWLGAALLSYLFRDPERPIPARPLGLVSPLDGRVTGVEEGLDPYLERDARCIRLEGSVTGIYTVRSPMEGKLIKQWYAVPGGASKRFVLASLLRSDEGDEIVLVVRPRPGWLRLRSNIAPGERCGQGMRFCFAPFGARVEIQVPLATRIQVQPGERVRSGSDIIGSLNHGP